MAKRSEIEALRFRLRKTELYNKILILRLKMCGVHDIIELRFDEDEHPRDDDGKFKDKPDAALNNDKYFMPEDKIKKFLLSEGAKHSKEFFDVGYSIDNWQKLNDDIYDNFDMNKATDFKKLQNGGSRFSLFMELGIDKKKSFRTVWQKDDENAKPRFITAHREDEK